MIGQGKRRDKKAYRAATGTTAADCKCQCLAEIYALIADRVKKQRRSDGSRRLGSGGSAQRVGNCKRDRKNARARVGMSRRRATRGERGRTIAEVPCKRDRVAVRICA